MQEYSNKVTIMRPLSITDSSVLKGIAILMMLFGHVFTGPGSYDDIVIGGSGIIRLLATRYAPIVAIFVFVSGYGLTAKYGNKGKIVLKTFYWSRFVKLMLNYWFIWLIFVPISLLWLSDKPFGWSYGGTFIHLKSVLDFLGIINWFGGSTPYNPTWWFYSCIIGLYLLFPLLLRICRSSMFFMVGLAVAFCLLPTALWASVRGYLLVFVSGMAIAILTSHDTAPPSASHKTGLAWLLLFVLLFILRMRVPWSVINLYDALLITVGVILYMVVGLSNFITKILAFLGHYSMDMFLTHTFLFSLWPVTRNMVYATTNPLVIYITLVALSLALAMLLGWVKNVTGYNRLINYLRNKIQ